ncbi:MAG: Omp28-related outer membrane protein [Edaphocola sp.]
MKKRILFPAVALGLWAASCKEYVDPIASTALATDSTYVAAVEDAAAKRILVEELSGVICPNCPSGAAKLETLSATDSLSIVTIHTGSLTTPISGKSTQDFRSSDGAGIIAYVYNGVDPSKPAAAFDRLPLNAATDQTNKWFIEGYNKWESGIASAKASTAPVNIDIVSVFNSETDKYDITVWVKYTQATTGKQALNIVLTESGIEDYQEYSGAKIDLFTFNHVLRKSLTNVSTGQAILDSLDTKEAGRVYLYRTSVDVSQPDEKNNSWVAENMTITAFVTENTDPATDRRVLQVADAKLVK